MIKKELKMLAEAIKSGRTRDDTDGFYLFLEFLEDEEFDYFMKLRFPKAWKSDKKESKNNLRLRYDNEK